MASKSCLLGLAYFMICCILRDAHVYITKHLCDLSITKTIIVLWCQFLWKYIQNTIDSWWTKSKFKEGCNINPTELKKLNWANFVKFHSYAIKNDKARKWLCNTLSPESSAMHSDLFSEFWSDDSFWGYTAQIWLSSIPIVFIGVEDYRKNEKGQQRSWRPNKDQRVNNA